jgi:hypothetical protein
VGAIHENGGVRGRCVPFYLVGTNAEADKERRKMIEGAVLDFF